MSSAYFFGLLIWEKRPIRSCAAKLERHDVKKKNGKRRKYFLQFGTPFGIICALFGRERRENAALQFGYALKNFTDATLSFFLVMMGGDKDFLKDGSPPTVKVFQCVSELF